MATENKTLLSLAFIPRYEGIGLAQRAILYAMSRYTNQETGTFWPSLQTIADDLKTDLRWVRRSVRRLEGMGILKRRGFKELPVGKITIWSLRSPEWVAKHTPGSIDPPSPGQTSNIPQGLLTLRTVEKKTIERTSSAPLAQTQESNIK